MLGKLQDFTYIPSKSGDTTLPLPSNTSAPVSTPPVFILAPGHSFTSIVCAMLGQHPALYGVPELNLFVADTVGGVFDFFQASQGMPARGRFRLGGLARMVAQIHDGAQTEETVEWAWNWLQEHQDWSTARLAWHFAEAIAPRAMVDKTPTNVRSLDSLRRIDRTFPDATYLHLTRHPQTTCESLYRRYEGWTAKGTGTRKKRTAMEARASRLEEIWLDAHSMLLEWSMDLGPRRYARVQGEALLADPDVYLPQIAAWLGVDASSDAVEAMKHPEASPFSRVGPPNARGGNNRGFLEAPQLRKYTPKAHSLDAGLPWMGPEARFAPQTVALAHLFGYA